MKTTSYYWRKTILYVIAFVAVLLAGAAIFAAYRSVFSLIVYGLVTLGGLFLLASWHSRTFAYRCAECGLEYEISVWRNLATHTEWTKVAAGSIRAVQVVDTG